MNTQRINWSMTDSIVACGLGMLLATLTGCADLEKQAMESKTPQIEKPSGSIESATAEEPGLKLAMAGKDGKELARVVGSVQKDAKDVDKKDKPGAVDTTKLEVAARDVAGSPNCEDDQAGLEAGHIGQNIFLMAEALGLKAGIVGAFNDEQVIRIMEIPSTHEPLLIMPVGHKD